MSTTREFFPGIFFTTCKEKKHTPYNDSNAPFAAFFYVKQNAKTTVLKTAFVTEILQMFKLC